MLIPRDLLGQYEYGTGGDAINRTNFRETELASLDDYRVRYQQYRTDVSFMTKSIDIAIHRDASLNLMFLSSPTCRPVTRTCPGS